MEMREPRRLTGWQDLPASCAANSFCEGAHLLLEGSLGRTGSLQHTFNADYHFEDEWTDGQGCLKVKRGASETQKPSPCFAGLAT